MALRRLLTDIMGAPQWRGPDRKQVRGSGFETRRTYLTWVQPDVEPAGRPFCSSVGKATGSTSEEGLRCGEVPDRIGYRRRQIGKHPNAGSSLRARTLSGRAADLSIPKVGGSIPSGRSNMNERTKL